MSLKLTNNNKTHNDILRWQTNYSALQNQSMVTKTSMNQNFINTADSLVLQNIDNLSHIES